MYLKINRSPSETPGGVLLGILGGDVPPGPRNSDPTSVVPPGSLGGVGEGTLGTDWCINSKVNAWRTYKRKLYNKSPLTGPRDPELAIITTQKQEKSVIIILTCENSRFSSLFAAEDVSRETSPAAKSEEKRLFSCVFCFFVCIVLLSS